MGRREKQQPSFAVCKANALRKLAEADKSPKGCLDPHIAPLVHAINAHPDYVTTSSCAGRVVLWAEGSGAKAETETDARTDDAGGRWLLCQHDRVSLTQIEALVPTEAAPAEAAQVARAADSLFPAILPPANHSPASTPLGRWRSSTSPQSSTCSAATSKPHDRSSPSLSPLASESRA